MLPSVIVVSQNASQAAVLLRWLSSVPCEPTVVTTFASARARLGARADLVITDVKLGAFNGLHLAARAQRAGVPVIALGPADPVLERVARELGASYVGSRLDRDNLVRLVQRLLGTAADAESETFEKSDEIADLWFAWSAAPAVEQPDAHVIRLRSRLILH